ARSIRRTQLAQVMPVTGKVTCSNSGGSIEVLGGAWSIAILGFPGKLEQLAELADHLVVAALVEAGPDTAVQVALQQDALQLVDGPLDRIGLFQDVDAVLILVDHLADPLQVALDVGQPPEYVRFGRLHDEWPRLVLPPGEGFRLRITPIGWLDG